MQDGYSGYIGLYSHYALMDAKSFYISGTMVNEQSGKRRNCTYYSADTISPSSYPTLSPADTIHSSLKTTDYEYGVNITIMFKEPLTVNETNKIIKYLTNYTNIILTADEYNQLDTDCIGDKSVQIIGNHTINQVIEICNEEQREILIAEYDITELKHDLINITDNKFNITITKINTTPSHTKVQNNAIWIGLFSFLFVICCCICIILLGFRWRIRQQRNFKEAEENLTPTGDTKDINYKVKYRTKRLQLAPVNSASIDSDVNMETEIEMHSDIANKLGSGHLSDIQETDTGTDVRSSDDIVIIETAGQETRRGVETAGGHAQNGIGDEQNHNEQIRLWLANFGMEQYLTNFIEHGYDKLQFIKQIKDVSELIEIGIEDNSDQIILIGNINRTDMGY